MADLIKVSKKRRLNINTILGIVCILILIIFAITLVLIYTST